MAEPGMQEQLTNLLRHFQVTAPGIVGSALITMDGFSVASELPETVEEDRVAAMAAAIMALGEETTGEFEYGDLERVFIEGKKGCMIIINTGNEVILSTVTRKDAKLGFVLLQMARVAKSAQQIMQE
jgi:predicted regulator of Ras-like GTPase activity (Roadblock/LC7/MglB family)